jgi:hypothetical protein
MQIQLAAYGYEFISLLFTLLSINVKTDLLCARFEGICEGGSIVLLGPNLGLDGDDLSASPSDLFTAAGKEPTVSVER